MVDYIGLGADIAVLAVAIVGTYYTSVCNRLFKGDVIMEKVWRLATFAFVIVVLFTALDFIFTAEDSSLVQLHLVRIASAFALAVFVVAIMTLARWGRTSTEPRIQR